jgi:hypothetical protein
MRYYLVLLLIIVVLTSFFAYASESNPGAEKAAIESAQTWLALVDGGKYSESWEEAAGYFQSAVKKESWEQTIRAVREPLGKTVSRKLKSQQYATSLPGAPDGEYVVIQFNTMFENKNWIKTVNGGFPVTI